MYLMLSKQPAVARARGRRARAACRARACRAHAFHCVPGGAGRLEVPKHVRALAHACSARECMLCRGCVPKFRAT
eukprot:6232519-Lingulodinium_polyedra.AAC.1